jgi:hypothetical protein
MSTIEEAVVSRLKATAAVAAITTKHYPLVAAQGASVPYTVYQVISSPELRICEFVRVRIQVSCWAATYGSSVALANAVRACFYNQHLTILGVHFRCWVDNVFDGEPDIQSGEHCRIVDVRFDYRNPT